MKLENILLLILAIALVFLIVFLIISLPPHTDPGVEVLEPGRARVHNGEKLVLWVPSGKTQAKYTFLYKDNTITVSAFLVYYQRTISEGCESFRVGLFYKVTACRDNNNVIFEWPEFFLGVRIDR